MRTHLYQNETKYYIQASISSKLHPKKKKELERGSNLPPMGQPLQIQNFCSLDDTTVDDVQQRKGPAKKL